MVNLKDLDKLIYLNLSHNSLTSIHGLEGCTQIRYLNLDHNRITRISKRCVLFDYSLMILCPSLFNLGKGYLSILLHMGRSLLNEHLHKIGIKESPLCSCGQGACLLNRPRCRKWLALYYELFYSLGYSSKTQVQGNS